jgi:sulfonate transport system substrate-binding protein
MVDPTGPYEVYYTICPVESTSHVAMRRGFFNEVFGSSGVVFKHISSLGRDSWNIHFDHSHPCFFRDGGNIPPIWARSRGADTVLVGFTFPMRRQVLLVREDSKFCVVSDLKGARIARPFRRKAPIDFWRATVERGVLCCLNCAGLRQEDVEFVDIELPEYLAEGAKAGSIWSHQEDFERFVGEELVQLKKGRVDAVYTEGARVGAIEQMRGFRTIYSLSDQSDFYDQVNICLPCVITVSGDLARRFPEIVVLYMKALILASNWADENKEEVTKIFAKELGVSREHFTKSFPLTFNELLRPSADDTGINALNVEKDFLLEKGYISRDFDVSEWVNAKFIEEASMNLTR